MPAEIRGWERRSSGGPRYGSAHPRVPPTTRRSRGLAADVLHSRVNASFVRGVGDTDVRWWAPMGGTSKSVPVFASRLS
jgi:hypothetical protein